LDWYQRKAKTCRFKSGSIDRIKLLEGTSSPQHRETDLIAIFAYDTFNDITVGDEIQVAGGEGCSKN
jgi:hypothetical protein